MPFRNPDLLALMAHTVDEISAGRLILGLGAGWHEGEFLANGYAFGTVGSRLDALGEGLQRIDRRLQALRSPGVSRIPVLLGGGGERRTLRFVAEHADIWHAFPEAGSYDRKVAALRAHCLAVGRPIEEIEFSVGVGGLGREGRSPGRPDVEGAEWLAHGATFFTMNCSGPAYDITALRPWLEWRDALNSDLAPSGAAS